MTGSWHRNVVAVTGTIGSGKSTACKMLARKGAYTVSADELAREAVAPGSAGLNEVVRSFGPGVLREDGTLDRKLLGAVVFADPEKRRRLESITHPIIRALAAERFAVGEKLKSPLMVYDCPLLFEAGLERCGFRQIVLIAADDEVCIARIMARDELSREEARQRIDNQFPIALKRERSDIVIDNSGSLQQLEEQLDEVFARLAAPHSPQDSDNV